MGKKASDQPVLNDISEGLGQALARARGEDVSGLFVHAPHEVEDDAPSGMALSDFTIGGEFLCGPGRWRCTDIGTRVVVAIRVDQTELTTKEADGPAVTRTLPGAEAEAMGLFNGPPYGVLESVFDEDDREACSPVEG